MVALAHLVSHIAAVVVSIYIAHEALFPSALRTLYFLLSVTRHFRGLQLISVIVIHNNPYLNSLSIHPNLHIYVGLDGWIIG